jgi:hypothetical protein
VFTISLPLFFTNSKVARLNDFDTSRSFRINAPPGGPEEAGVFRLFRLLLIPDRILGDRRAARLDPAFDVLGCVQNAKDRLGG